MHRDRRLRRRLEKCHGEDPDMEGIVIAAGGTGGHLYPAVAVARELADLAAGSDPLFVSGARGMETRILEREGFRHAHVPASPWKRKRPWTLAASLFNALRGAIRAMRLLEDEKARVVFSTGGYATVPTLLAALLKKVPVVLHEPDSVPGVTNRIFGRWAARIATGAEEAIQNFPAEHVIFTGVPVRRAFFEMQRAQARKQLELDPDRLVILVLGGSQGARPLNRAVSAALPGLAQEAGRLALVWICGEKELPGLESLTARAPMPVRLFGYLDDIAPALKAADLALARAGASTLAEILACGLPSILVPYPHATADHQRRNALVLARAGAAEILEEKDLTGARLTEQVLKLAQDDIRREMMARAAAGMARPTAARMIAAEIVTAMRGGAPC